MWVSPGRQVEWGMRDSSQASHLQDVCFFWFNCAYNIVIPYRRKGSLEVEVAVVNKLNIYIKI